MANLMFDTQLRKCDYARYNSLLALKNTQFYVAMSSFHSIGFMYMAYFFRFRRVTLAPALLISSAYYYFFTKTNNIAYKLMVDRHVLNLARQSGQGKHV